MKKLMTLVLTMALVLGMGTFALAVDTETAALDVGIEIGQYFELAIVSEFFEGSAGNNPLFGLFNEENMISGQLGYYVSDGNATVGRAQTLFGRSDAPVNTPDRDGVEMVVVAANTETILEMDVDWGEMIDEEYIQAFFRFSSNEDIGDEFDDPVIGIGGFPGIMDVGHYNTEMSAGRPDFNNMLIERGNLSYDTFSRLGDAMGLAGYSWGQHMGYVGSWEDASQSDIISIPFRNCTPSLIHINGAVEILKATGLPAGTHKLGTVGLTLSADPAFDGSTWPVVENY